MKAADSLFILGSNGILTEHVLTPQKATGVPEGDDAPIELSHKPELEWNLLRLGSFYVRASLIIFYFRKSQWAKFSATYGKDCPLVVAYNNLKEHRKGEVIIFS